MFSDYTMVIPTHNRPDDLAKLLSYLERNEVLFRVLILDSSGLDAQETNATRIASSQLSIRHWRFDPATGLTEKLYEGIMALDTTYCSFCADDDVVIMPAISDCLKYLRSNADYVTVQGYYFSFFLKEEESRCNVHIPSLLYFTPSLEAASPDARLIEFISRYQPLFYGVHRTVSLQQCYRSAKEVKGFLFEEFLPACELVIAGKVARIPTLYYGRNSGNDFADNGNPRNFTGHPVNWIINDPESLFPAFAKYREALIRALQRKMEAPPPEERLRQGLNLLHIGYLSQGIDSESFYTWAQDVFNGDDLSLEAEFYADSGYDASNTINVTRELDGGNRRRYIFSGGFLRHMREEGSDKNAIILPEDARKLVAHLDRY